MAAGELPVTTAAVTAAGETAPTGEPATIVTATTAVPATGALVTGEPATARA